VVEHEGLAKVFEKHLNNDFNNNRSFDPFEAFEGLELIVPEDLLQPDPRERLDRFEYFEPFDETRDFTVTPLLTPDNFIDGIVDVIESAEEELLIQNQTFNAPGSNQTSLKRLMSAVKDRQEAGLRVKIIFRSFNRSVDRSKLEALKRFGIDTDDIRLMKGCHTKGVIVDRKKVVIGSHNWSNAGVSTNRDASLYFEDEALAGYFRKVFWHDWDNLARRQISRGRRRIELVPREADVPPGMVKVSWKEFCETL
jgi:phosphatidylserine/phosphatidylglycerophosphate/cardiolipin synthase-like enzyme